MSKKRKLLISLIVILFWLAAAAYGCGVYYFSSHFLPGSTVNGFNCSYMTVKEAEELLTKEIQAYVLTLDEKNNGRESITAQQAGLSYDSDGSVDRLIKEQKRLSWFLAFNQQEVYEVPSAVKYDEQKTEDAIASLKCMQTQTEPVDASIMETENGFVITPETEGTALKPKKTRKSIIKAFCSGQTELNLEGAGCYKRPKVYQDDALLIQNCQVMNTLTDVIITYDFDDRTETVDESLIKNWITADEEGRYVLDQTQVLAWVGELAAKYDTVGNIRTFTTFDGREKTLEEGDYGWKIDTEAETRALMEDIENGVIEVRTPVYAQEGLCRKTNDIGYTYIEIDLTSQRMIFYKDGVPTADTQIMSGNPYVPGCETPTGCYRVSGKESGVVVAGEDYPSSVNFRIRFGDILGINDAPWRGSYGGQIYEFEGTNGNICAPSDQVQIIYNYVEENTPVVIYK